MTLPLGTVTTEENRGLYWASQTLFFTRTKSQMILPRDWVASSRLYKEVSKDLDPGRLTDLAGRVQDFESAPTLEKCVAEAIYEQARAVVLPAAPSRLHCLFAGLDAKAAIDFAAAYLPPPVFDASGMGQSGFFPVSTADGKWVMLDMNLFSLKRIGSDVATTSAALAELRQSAERYWCGEQSGSSYVEVLCEKLWLYTYFLSPSGEPIAYRDFMQRQ